MCNDYIIANHRLRVKGPHSDLAGLGLAAFTPFSVEYNECAQCDMVMTMAADISLEAEALTELTHFDFAEGEAVCRFLRGKKYYVLTIENDKHPLHIFLCDRQNPSQVFTNAGKVEVSPSFLRFGMWFMLNVNTIHRQTAAIHSSAICYRGEVVLFLGESGTGKSTHTRLWRENVEGATLLNDDSPYVGIRDGQVVAYGSPWSGKTPCYKNECYPIRAFVRLSQAPYNKIQSLRGVRAIGALLPSLPPAFAFDAHLEDCVMDTLSAIISRVPVYHLECLPDGAAAKLSCKTIFYGDAE